MTYELLCDKDNSLIIVDGYQRKDRLKDKM